jgi:hypothetical protein
METIWIIKIDEDEFFWFIEIVNIDEKVVEEVNWYSLWQTW